MSALASKFGAGLLAVTLVAGLLLAGGPYAGTAYACSCAGTSSVDEEFRYSDAVFAGEMVRSGIDDPRPNDGAMFGGIEFRVDESWKGVPGDSVVVYGQDTSYYGELEEGDVAVSNSCTYSFVEGESYLVYAVRYEDGFQVGPCSLTAPLSGAGKDIRALDASAGRLPDTGGPPLPLIGVLAAAAFPISAGLLFRWVRS